jgi:hypothetical protein
MRILMFAIIIVFTVSISCNSHGTTQNNGNSIDLGEKDIGPSSDEIDIATIPKDSIQNKLFDYVSKNFTDFELIKEEDYLAGWDNYISAGEHPNLVIGDYDGNLIDDYILLLTKKDLISIVAFHFDGKQFSSYPVSSYYFEGSDNQIIISLEKKGLWEGIGRSVQVDNDGISAIWFNESRSVSFYWNGTQYVKF